MDLETICLRISDIANDDTLKIGGTNYGRCKGWVRESYYLDILAQRPDWWFLRKTEEVPTVSGTAIVSLPTGVDIKTVREIKITGYAPLNGISESDADRLNRDLTVPGRPTTFWQYDYDITTEKHRLQLYPVPDTVYTLNVRTIATPNVLDDDDDVPSLPSIFQYLLIKGGYVKALKHNQDPNYENEFAEYMMQIKRLLSWNARDEYRTDSWWK
jgi:hypothetical protein